MSKQLLVDYSLFEISPELISESEKNNNGRVIVTGVLQRSGAKNQNGRVYPREILMREVTKYSDTFIAENRALGELDHPESSVVNLSNVSHNIRKVWWKGDDVVGEVEINGTVEVQDDFELVCWDFVSNPSTHGAFMHPAGVNESVSNSMPASKYVNIHNIINDMLCDLTCKCALPNRKK